MRTRTLAVLLAAAAVLAACADEPTSTAATPAPRADVTPVMPPVLTEISPRSGPTAGGTQVTLTGVNFGPAVRVMFGGGLAPVLSQSETSVVVQSLPGDGIVQVYAINYLGMVTAPLMFTYDAPTISSVLPAQGPSSGGNTVTIVGNNFGLRPSVAFGSSVAPIVTRSFTSITVVAPAGNGAVAVRVSTPSGSVAAAEPYVYDAPVLSSITPATGPTQGGNLITLVGSNFGTTGTVQFGSASVAPATWSHTVVTAPAPAGEGSVDVRLVTANGVTGSQTYRYDAPTIASIVPGNGSSAGGTLITIAGTNFGRSPSVTVGGRALTLHSSSHTQIVGYTPTGTPGSAAPVVVSVAGAASQGTAAFTYDAPTISSVSPASGPAAGGIPITINGTNLGTAPIVTVGAAMAPVTSANHTQIVATLPPGPAGTAPVRVTYGDVSSNAGSFTYIGTPTIASISPATGPTQGGIPITINGSNFSASATVRLNATAVTPVSATATQVVFTLPAGEGSMNVVVEANGLTSAPVTFSYGLPAISQISPQSGPLAGGNQVTITGQNFGPVPTVLFGSASAPIVSRSHTMVVAIAPAATEGGPVNVRVVSGAHFTSNPVSYTYDFPAPSIAAISPTNGPTAGGIPITISGSNFGAAARVSFGGQVVTPTSATLTQLVFALPAGEGRTDVSVVANGKQSNTTAFTYDAPVVSSILPASGPVAGGNTITISGQNFGLTPSVTIGGQDAPLLTRSHTTLTVTAPAGSTAGPADVRVTVAGLASGGSPTYTYEFPAPSIAAISPASGPTAGGIPITINGSNFGANARVSFGGSVVTPTSATLTQLVFTLPAGEGRADVSVTANGKQSGTVTFAYDAPVVSSITPSTGLVTGGTTITITGRNFGFSPVVTFGDALAPLVSASHTQLVVTSPIGAPGSVPVRVQVAGAAGNTLAFTYVCASGTYEEAGKCVTPAQAATLIAVIATELGLGSSLTDMAAILNDANPKNDVAACGQLQAVLNQLASRERQGRVSAADATALRQSIDRLRQELGCR